MVAFTKILYHADMRLINTEIFSFWKLFVPMVLIGCFSLTENICAKKYDHVFKIALVGERGVGKTQIINQFTTGVLDKEYTPTMSVCIANKDYIFNNETIRISIYDIPGDIDNIATYKTFLQNVNVILVVYDVTDEYSFNNCENWVKSVRATIPCNKTDLILVGNKIDSNDALRVISSEHGENRAFFQGYGFTSHDNKQLLSFFEVSANKNIGIEELFDKIIIHLFISKKLSNPAVVDGPPSEKNIETQNHKKCCYFCFIF